MLNAVDLRVTSAVIDTTDGEFEAAIDLDTDRERMNLSTTAKLPVGDATIRVVFDGILNDDLRGFYRSTYTDADGVEHVLATTQLESTDARRAFPCWDEPDLKATFAVSLTAPPGMTAVSNGPEAGREVLDDGSTRITFATSPVMSTYLVACIVGDLVATDPVDVDGIPLRVVTPPGQLHLADFALEAGAHALRYFASYYEVPYPGDKLDMVAVPDFGFGAMENLGCIVYRETALLIDPATATQRELSRVASVIAHEIAHMWFGDLVTMKWWNGIWLNEAFATFAETKCTAAFRPDWEFWLAFAADRARSQETDALASTRSIEFPVASPAEAHAMFDVLTYEKGSSVLRMLEQYLGEEPFRGGISHYLAKHSFSNTDTEDLWAALEHASGEPVGEIMDTWIYQGGYPVVDVASSDEGVTVRQRQFRLVGEGSNEWKIPMLYRSDDGVGRLVLGADPATLDVEGDVVVNAGGEGFYRVEYDERLFRSILERLPDLEPIERFSVVSDASASMLSGRIAGGEFLELVDRLGDEREFDIWAAALAGVDELDRVVSSDDRDRLRRHVRALVAPTVDELGWTPEPGESDRRRALRGLMIRSLGNLGSDPDTLATSRAMIDGGGDIDAEVEDAALSIVANHGEVDDFHRFLDWSENADNPQRKVKYLRLAATVPHPDVPQHLFDMIMRGDVRSQDSFWLLAVLLAHRENGPRTWAIVEERWDDLMAILAPDHRYRILDGIKYRSEPRVAEAIRTWFSTHTIDGFDKAIAQRLEMLDVRVGLHEREAERVGEALD